MRGLSPPILQSGGAQAPSAPPISPPMMYNILYIVKMVTFYTHTHTL